MFWNLFSYAVSLPNSMQIYAYKNLFVSDVISIFLNICRYFKKEKGHIKPEVFELER